MSFFKANYALDINKQAFTKVEVTDKAAISQSIESIILTSKRERIFFPAFGSFLNEEIFKNINEESGEEILDKLIRLIKTWEKRIYIDEAKCTMSINVEKHTLTLNIVYYLLSDGSTGSFNKKIVF